MNAAKTIPALLALLSTFALSACDIDESSESPGVFRNAQPDYDAAADFDAANQGSQGWEYLYDAAGDGSYAPLSVGPTYWGFPAWRDGTCTSASARLDGSNVLVTPPGINGCDGWITLAWQAPSDGVADISVTVAEVDGCTSGVEFELVDPSGAVLYAVADTEWGVTYSHQDTLAIDAGEHVYLRVAHGPGGDWCDTTALTFQVDHAVETSVIVAANYDINADIHNDWLDTGIDVVGGRDLDITATGSANHIGNPNDMYDANGLGPAVGPTMLAEGLAFGSLVGRIGEGEPFEIGTNFSMPAGASGRLYLGFNDSRCDDNIGQFNVSVTH